MKNLVPSKILQFWLSKTSICWIFLKKYTGEFCLTSLILQNEKVSLLRRITCLKLLWILSLMPTKAGSSTPRWRKNAVTKLSVETFWSKDLSLILIAKIYLSKQSNLRKKCKILKILEKWSTKFKMIKLVLIKSGKF